MRLYCSEPLISGISTLGCKKSQMELCHINDEGKKAMGVNQQKETLETLLTKCLHDK